MRCQSGASPSSIALHASSELPHTASSGDRVCAQRAPTKLFRCPGDPLLACEGTEIVGELPAERSPLSNRGEGRRGVRAVEAQRHISETPQRRRA